jgi:hypothetical protein
LQQEKGEPLPGLQLWPREGSLLGTPETLRFPEMESFKLDVSLDLEDREVVFSPPPEEMMSEIDLGKKLEPASSPPCSNWRREKRTGGRFRKNCRSISGYFKCCMQQKEEEKVVEICTTVVWKYANHLCFLSYLHIVYYMISKCGYYFFCSAKMSKI